MKKNYISPIVRAISIKSESIICTSPTPKTVRMRFALDEDEEEEEGYAD